MKRRTFLNMAAGTGALSALGESGALAETPASPARRLRNLERPAAIAMWDFSWLLRHHPAGSFEDWDRVLDELCERGYDAIRIDVFPALVASKPDGSVQDSYYFPKNNWKPAMWGNAYSVHADPRQGLLEFLPKCAQRGVRVGMSTWFFGPGVGEVEGLDGFVRVWDETLRFLDAAGQLDNCLYVDLLNEYPLFHGFSWFAEKLKSIGEGRDDGASREAHQWSKDMGSYNAPQVAYYRDFMTAAITRLRADWPELDFFACMTYNSTAPWRNMDCSEFDALEVHYWAALNALLVQDTGYWEHIHNLGKNDLAFPEVQRAVTENWQAHKGAIMDWLDAEVAGVAAAARELGAPCGNTEGWGLINWLDHPALTWDIIKEAGLFGAALGRKYGYRYNCSSNFTHPQFGRFWRDAGWHREVTSEIRGG